MIVPKIGIYGRMNVGKSTLMNTLLGHQSVIVSPEAGTTTDPVRRRVEILDFAPVILIDTAGYDDCSPLGEQRVVKTRLTLREIDLAILVTQDDVTNDDERFIEELTVPYIVVKVCENPTRDCVFEQIKHAIPLSTLMEPSFFGNRISQGDVVVLVCPIDSEAPSGRLILPQVQALRSALDGHAIAIVVQPHELSLVFQKIMPRLVVTDSQAFDVVSSIVPPSVELTSFSILLSELKGDPRAYRAGLGVLGDLKDGDRVVLIEHCTHQTSCDDIARFQIPRLLSSKLGVQLRVDVVREIDDFSDVSLLVQCGGCMTNRRAVMTNIELARRASIAITNYGMLLKFLLSK